MAVENRAVGAAVHTPAAWRVLVSRYAASPAGIQTAGCEAISRGDCPGGVGKPLDGAVRLP